MYYHGITLRLRKKISLGEEYDLQDPLRVQESHPIGLELRRESVEPGRPPVNLFIPAYKEIKEGESGDRQPQIPLIEVTWRFRRYVS